MGVCISFLVLNERFILGLAQLRVGPRVVRLFGLMQTLVDRGKLFLKKTTKVDLLPAFLFFTFSIVAVGVANGRSSGWLHCLLVLALLSLSLFVVCLINSSTYGYIAAYRTVLMAVSFDIVFGFFFMVICLLELGRTPYDLVEGESELVSRYNVEYARFGFTLLFLGEYMGFYWIFRLMGELYVCYYFVAFLLHTLVIAIRAVLPRYKYNQVLRFSWGFANLLIFFMFLI